MTLIALEGITKRFGGVTALDGVSFDIAAGEVHAVVGENGAGKSSLMKLLAGVYTPDAGRILLDGHPQRIRSPLDSRRLGISVVFQELSLFPHRSVTANVFANRELSTRSALLDRGAMRRATRQALTALGSDIEPDARVETLSVGEKQLVELARALSERSRIVILDEPNSALSEPESERLFHIVQRMREAGTTVLYVSHRMEEVFALANRITVLRDGRSMETFDRDRVSIPQVISAMIGRESPSQLFPKRSSVAPKSPITLRAKDVCDASGLGPISFEARQGEILGFAGLEGSGIDALFQLLFGLERVRSGSLFIGAEPRHFRSPREAMRCGLALIPASRREEGLTMTWDVRRNATLLILKRLKTRLGLIDRPAVDRKTWEIVKQLRVATDRIDRTISTLSGGNQQKVLLAKWLATDPAVLILNDPTRGVDVGAKEDIYKLCDQLARQGMTILLTSSEIEETLALSDRILVMRAGRIVREFNRGEANKEKVMFWITSEGGNDEV